MLKLKTPHAVIKTQCSRIIKNLGNICLKFIGNVKFLVIAKKIFFERTKLENLTPAYFSSLKL